MKRSLVVCVLALMLALPSLAAASGHVMWIQTYDPAAGEFPEGIAVDKQGNVFVSMAPIGQIRKISPEGTETLFYQFPPGGGLTGLAVDAPGNVYVGVFAGGAGPARGSGASTGMAGPPRACREQRTSSCPTAWPSTTRAIST